MGRGRINRGIGNREGGGQRGRWTEREVDGWGGGQRKVDRQGGWTEREVERRGGKHEVRWTEGGGRTGRVDI